MYLSSCTPHTNPPGQVSLLPFYTGGCLTYQGYLEETGRDISAPNTTPTAKPLLELGHFGLFCSEEGQYVHVMFVSSSGL